MLILTRYLNHGDRSVICIGQDIQITLVHVDGDQVQLAVELPDALPLSLHNGLLPHPLPVSALRPAGKG